MTKDNLTIKNEESPKEFLIRSVSNDELDDCVRLGKAVTKWASTNWVDGNAKRHIGIQDVYAYNDGKFDKDPDAVLSRYKTIYDLSERDFCTIAFAIYGRKRISEGKEWIE